VAKREKPHWGARKIRDRLVRRLDGDIRVPAKNAIGARCGASQAVEVASAIIVTGFSVGCKKAGLSIRP
jgi:hypothetical protein